jgi:hypothetical protein
MKQRLDAAVSLSTLLGDDSHFSSEVGELLS